MCYFIIIVIEFENVMLMIFFTIIHFSIDVKLIDNIEIYNDTYFNFLFSIILLYQLYLIGNLFNG